MPAHPLNRPHCVDQKTGDFLHKLYELLFYAEVHPRIKQRTLETAAESKDSWRVVSISEAAIEHIQTTKSATGLQRGHIMSRVERARHLFGRCTPMARDDLIQYFFEHDTVALVTKAENSRAGAAHWSTLRAVPEGLFNAGTFAIYVRKGKELVWAEDRGSRGAA